MGSLKRATFSLLNTSRSSSPKSTSRKSSSRKCRRSSSPPCSPSVRNSTPMTATTASRSSAMTSWSTKTSSSGSSRLTLTPAWRRATPSSKCYYPAWSTMPSNSPSTSSFLLSDGTPLLRQQPLLPRLLRLRAISHARRERIAALVRRASFVKRACIQWKDTQMKRTCGSSWCSCSSRR